MPDVAPLPAAPSSPSAVPPSSGTPTSDDPESPPDPEDSAPEPPVAEPSVPGVVTMTALTATTQSALAGTLVDAPPRVVVRDSGGLPLPGQSVRFRVAGGGAIGNATVLTDSDGTASVAAWRLGRYVTANSVTAELVSDSAIAAQFTATIRTDYTVTVQYLSTVTDDQRAAFDNAAARWSAVIIGELPNFSVRRSELSTACGGDATDTQRINVDDVLIFASVAPIDGPGGVLGQASPCYQHQSGAIAIGIMAFDSDDMSFLESTGKFEDTILHEMGHVIGIGSLWSREGLVTSPSVGSPGANTRFTGEAAALAYVAAGGSASDNTVPVENSGQQGSADAHWRESVFRNELMSPSISGTEASLPLSAITVASLEDLGFYTVNQAASDPFTLASSLMRSAPAEPVMQCATGTLLRPD